MERSRTIYRLREYKTPITMLVILSSIGLIIFFAINIFDKLIIELLRQRVSSVLETVYLDDINYAMSMVTQSYSFFANAAFIATVLSLVGFLMLLLFIRTGKVSKLKHFALNSLGLGGILMALLYFLIGLYLPEKGDVESTFQKFRILQVVAVCFITLGHVLFFIHVFKSIIIERD